MKPPPARLPVILLGAVALASVATSAAAAEKAHTHGVVRLDVAIDKELLTLQLDAPLEAVLGFEHTPTTPAETAAAQALLKLWQDFGKLFKPNDAAGCVVGESDVVLDPASGSRKHADAQVQFQFRCRQIAALNSVELLLFDHHPRIQRIEIQVAGSRGQHKAVMRRGVGSKRLAIKP